MKDQAWHRRKPVDDGRIGHDMVGWGLGALFKAESILSILFLYGIASVGSDTLYSVAHGAVQSLFSGILLYPNDVWCNPVQPQ